MEWLRIKGRMGRTEKYPSVNPADVQISRQVTIMPQQVSPPSISEYHTEPKSGI
jgi:hypothetical protein